MKSLWELEKELNTLVSVDVTCNSLWSDSRFDKEIIGKIRTKLAGMIKEKLKEINNELN